MTTMQAYNIAAFQALLAAYENERDFSEWLTGLVAGVTAHVGGRYELTVGRPGSWETARIIEWTRSADCEIPEEAEHLRTHWTPALPSGDEPRPNRSNRPTDQCRRRVDPPGAYLCAARAHIAALALSASIDTPDVRESEHHLNPVRSRVDEFRHHYYDALPRS